MNVTSQGKFATIKLKVLLFFYCLLLLFVLVLQTEIKFMNNE